MSTQVICDQCGAIVNPGVRIEIRAHFVVPHPMGGKTSEIREIDVCSKECLAKISEDIR